jgi:hypothetical protein
MALGNAQIVNALRKYAMGSDLSCKKLLETIEMRGIV